MDYYNIKTRLPYHQDKDYQDSFINTIKRVLDNRLIDITLLPTYGTVEVIATKQEVQELQCLPQIGTSWTSVDRGMESGPRTVI